MKATVLIVLAALTVAAVCARVNQNEVGGLELSRSQRWWIKCWWPRIQYDSSTQICCYKASSECCSYGSLLHDKPQCSSDTEYLSDPCDCTKFYQCSAGELSHFQCPWRGAWDQDEEKCVQVETNPPELGGHRRCTLPNFPGIYGNYTLSVKSDIDNSTIAHFSDLAPVDSVFNVMAYLAGTHSHFSFDTAYDDKFWYSVTCINDVCGSDNATYWSFAINGVTSDVGVSSVFAHNGDVIDFTLTTF